MSKSPSPILFFYPFFFFFFLPCHVTCRILILWRGSNLHLLQWKHGVLTTREVPKSLLISPFSFIVSHLLLFSFLFQQVFCVGVPWWLSGKESTCQCRRLGFGPWVGKIPWRRNWQSMPVLFSYLGNSWTEETCCIQSLGLQKNQPRLVIKQQQHSVEYSDYISCISTQHNWFSEYRVFISLCLSQS